jgi:hypothetical protein
MGVDPKALRNARVTPAAGPQRPYPKLQLTKDTPSRSRLATANRCVTASWITREWCRRI